jgi:serine protease Do
MTTTRVIVLVLSLTCAFLLGREFARRQSDPTAPGAGYQVQVAAAVNARQALDRVAATRPTTFVDVVDRMRPSVVSIIGTSRSGRATQGGTGVVVSPDGGILTNYHVVAGLARIQVTLSSMDTYPATVVGQDVPTDLALIKIETTGLLPATFGDSDGLRAGEDALVIGNASGFGWSVTRGIISSLHRSNLDLREPRVDPGEIEKYTDYIQTDAAINFGNSGGPVVNARGEVIGIAVARTEASENIGFAIPSNDARFIANQLLRSGRVQRGYLGVRGADLSTVSNEERRRRAPGALGGLVVDLVVAGAPAERSGIARDDVIVALDGREVDSMAVLRNRVARIAPNTEVVLTVFRGGRAREVRAVVGLHPANVGDGKPED